MKNNKEVYKKLREEYSAEEIANFAMIPHETTEKEAKISKEEFAKLRLKRRAEMSEKERLLSGLLNIKYQMKSYVDSSYFDTSFNFANILGSYLKLVDRKQKEFSEDISIHPSRLNRILKGKEKIGKKLAYRLEGHSGGIIPAIFWWKLMQKEVEQEILTEIEMKAEEKKQVNYIVYKTKNKKIA